MRVRRVVEDDAPTLAALRVANRDFLAPFEPRRPAAFFTADGQAAMIEDVLLRGAEARLVVPCVIEADRGRVRARSGRRRRWCAGPSGPRTWGTGWRCRGRPRRVGT